MSWQYQEKRGGGEINKKKETAYFGGTLTSELSNIPSISVLFF